jgi:phage terminase small subunit
MPRTTLTPKQQRFVDAYLLSLNATHAYREAGYRGTGHVAEAAASRMLRNVEVAAAIAAAQVHLTTKIGMTQEAVLHEIDLLQHSNLAHYTVDDYGNLALAAHAPADAMRALSSLKKKIIHTPNGMIYETEIKLWNKPASLRMGGEHLGLFQPTAQEMPDIHVHVHTARDRLMSRVAHLARRHAEDATNGS